MFENMLDGYFRRAQPVALAAANEAREWMTCVVEELRAIRQTIAEDDRTVFARHGVVFTNVPGGQAATATGTPLPFTPLVNNSSEVVPPGEEWELEYAAFRATGATAGTVIIYRNGAIVFTGTANLGNIQSTVSGIGGLRFQGGDVVGYEMPAAAPTSFGGYFQFRVARQRASRTVRVAPAYENPTPTVVTTGGPDVTGQQTLPRHLGTAFQGISPIGEGRARANGTH